MNKIILIFILVSLSPLFSIEDFSNSDFWSVEKKDNITIYTKKDTGRIPVLCFHKIGEKPRYEITAKSFDEFLQYLNTHDFYLLSDKEYIKKDLSMVPSGFKPIVLGADDASEGNFLYDTDDEDTLNGKIIYHSNKPEISDNTMVSILEKNIKPVDGRINFTFYITFDNVPFRQTGGDSPIGKYYRGLPIVKTKFSYLLDNFIIGIHTTTHPITKETQVSSFKWELEEFYSIMESYLGNDINKINTLAYPYGCGDLKPELREMVSSFKYKDSSIIGAFDFDGYFTSSPYSSKVDNYEISRLGVDNQNIERVYGFLESIKLFRSERVIVVKNREFLEGFQLSSSDSVIVEEL